MFKWCLAVCLLPFSALQDIVCTYFNIIIRHLYFLKGFIKKEKQKQSLHGVVVCITYQWKRHSLYSNGGPPPQINTARHKPETKTDGKTPVIITIICSCGSSLQTGESFRNWIGSLLLDCNMYWAAIRMKLLKSLDNDSHH